MNNRVITNGKLPDRVCPTCGAQVKKEVRAGYLIYQCTKARSHWDDWEDAKRKVRRMVLGDLYDMDNMVLVFWDSNIAPDFKGHIWLWEGGWP